MANDTAVAIDMLLIEVKIDGLAVNLLMKWRTLLEQRREDGIV